MARKHPKPLYQLMFPLPQSCPHMVVAHATPESESDLYDNCSLLLSTITQLFDLLSTAARNTSNPIISDSNQSIFDLGRDLCEELGRRIQLLDRAHEVLAEGEEAEIAPAEASTVPARARNGKKS